MEKPYYSGRSMKEVRLIPKLRPKVSVEAEVITPDTFAGKKAVEIANLPVWEGNRKRLLGDLFKVKGNAPEDASQLRIVITSDVPRVKYIGMKMSSGEVVVRGDVDMHVGDEMIGGRIVVEGDADSFAGTRMRGGELIIEGDAGDYAGASYRGDWRGMRGGTVVVKGNAGSELGSWMVRGLIVVKGNTGAFAGVHARGGTILIEGKPGLRLGAQMTRGRIITFGRLDELLPGFYYEGEVSAVEINGRTVKGPFLKFVGDRVEDGEGHLFLRADKNRHLPLRSL